MWTRVSPRLHAFQLLSSFHIDISKRVSFCYEVNHLFRSPISSPWEVMSVPKIESCHNLIDFPYPGIQERCSLKKGIVVLMSFQICEPEWESGVVSMHWFLPPSLYFFVMAVFHHSFLSDTILQRSLAPIAIFVTSGSLIPSPPLFLGEVTIF